MRSLAASNPFLSARESLLAIFDEVRRKYEAAEKAAHERQLKRKSKTKQDKLNVVTDGRVEIWIRQDGSRCKYTDGDEDDNDILDELNGLSDVNVRPKICLRLLTSLLSMH